METNYPFSLNINEFIEYKYLNKDMLSELKPFTSNKNNKIYKTKNPWRKIEPRSEKNWLVANKFNKNEDEKFDPCEVGQCELLVFLNTIVVPCCLRIARPGMQFTTHFLHTRHV